MPVGVHEYVSTFPRNVGCVVVQRIGSSNVSPDLFDRLGVIRSTGLSCQTAHIVFGGSGSDCTPRREAYLALR